MKAKDHNKKLFKGVYEDSVLVNSQAVLEGQLLFDGVFLSVTYALALTFIFKYMIIGEFLKILLIMFLSKTMIVIIFKKFKEYILMFKVNLKILRETRAKNKKK